MKKFLFFLSFVFVFVFAIALGSLVFARSGDDRLPLSNTSLVEQQPLPTNNDGNPAEQPEAIIPEKYRVNTGQAAVESLTNTTTIYFTPQDENSSTTILFLYNTSSVTATVGLQTFQLDGTIYVDTAINVPPAGLVRVAGDIVSAPDAASWADAAFVNFTTFSTYARMTMPPGVKAEAYVVWNGGSTYNPNQVVPALPIRFSTDPATVFLPSIQGD